MASDRAYPIVEVEWLDSIGRGGWGSAGEYRKDLAPAAVAHRSVGYLLDDDALGPLLIQSYMDDTPEYEGERRVEGGTRIPRAAVLRVTKLR